MTIKQAIDKVDQLKPNSYSKAQKIEWLNELDTSVYWKLVRKVNPYEPFDPEKTYNTGALISFRNAPYTCQADGVTENPDTAPASWKEEEWEGYDSTDAELSDLTMLLAPVPYDIPLYTHWLCMQISLYNREIMQYNNEAMLYNMAWEELADHLNRTFPPVARATHFRL